MVIERRRRRQGEQGTDRTCAGGGDVGQVHLEQATRHQSRIEIGGEVRTGDLLIDGGDRVLERAERSDVVADHRAAGCQPTQPGGQPIFGGGRHSLGLLRFSAGVGRWIEAPAPGHRACGRQSGASTLQ